MLLKEKKILKLFYLIWLLFSSFALDAVIFFQSPSSTMSLTGTSAKLILNRSIDNFSGTFKISDLSAGSITQTSSDAIISFSKTSFLDTGVFKGSLTGALAPDDLDDKIYLDGNKTLNILSGKVTQQVIVSGTGNVILGSPDFMHPIILVDQDAELTLGLVGKLTNDIVMNGGTIHLTNDLYFKDDTQFLGTGTVNVNNLSVFFPATLSVPLSGNITFNNANDVTVNTRTTLNGTWSFSGSTANLKGTGVIVNISGGGILSVASGTTLYVHGIHLKGLSDSAGKITMGSSSSKVFFTTTTLELIGNYTLPRGQFRIEGAFCKIVFTYGECFIIDSVNSSFVVDGQLLLYDPIDVPDQSSPFVTTNSGTLSTINGGRIQSSYFSGSSSSSTSTSITTLTLTYTIPSSSAENISTTPIDLGSGSTMTFQNPNTATAYAMTFNGQNNTIKFDDFTSPAFILQQNVTLTVKNTKFLNFDPSQISLQGSGLAQAKIIFGDGVTLGIEKNLNLTSNQILCTGNVSFVGYGEPTLSLSSSAIVFNPTATATVSFRGLKVKYNSFNSLRCQSSAFCNILFQNSDIFMTSTGLTFDTGNLVIQDMVNMRGVSEVAAEGASIFNFTTSGLLIVLGASMLTFAPDLTIQYSPSTVNDGGVLSTQKRHFRLLNPSSILSFKRNYLNTGTTGLALDYGKLLIDDVLTVNTSLTSGRDFELGSAVNTTIFNNGDLKVIGVIRYMPTTYP